MKFAHFVFNSKSFPDVCLPLKNTDFGKKNKNELLMEKVSSIEMFQNFTGQLASEYILDFC
jgi:hypothetical protein